MKSVDNYIIIISEHVSGVQIKQTVCDVINQMRDVINEKLKIIVNRNKSFILF